MKSDIEQLLARNGQEYRCNQNIANVLNDEGRQWLEKAVEEKVEDLLQTLLIDTENDWNTRETAQRVARMLIHETFHGRYYPEPEITAFPNMLEYDQLYLTGPIPIRSTCAHHLQNIVGSCWIGVFPGSQVIGLSKFNRIVDWIASRPTIQEELTIQIADKVEDLTGAEGVGVVVKAEHHCMSHRGVKVHENDMTTSVLRGKLRDEDSLKQEFFTLLQGMKGYGNS